MAHWSIIVWPTAFIVLAKWHFFPAWINILFGVCVTVGLFASLLIHEYAHVLTGRMFGYQTRRIFLIPIGCVADFEQKIRGPEEIRIALAGPLASIILTGIAITAGMLFGKPRTCTTYFLLKFFGVMGFWNLCLALFNLIPVFPSDGGRILRSLTALAITLLFPSQAYRAQLLATRFVLRAISWPLAIGSVILTIKSTRIWLYIMILTLVIILGELEYWMLRHEEKLDPPESPSITPE